MPTMFLGVVFSTWSSDLAGRCEKSHAVRKTSSDKAVASAFRVVLAKADVNFC